MLESAAGRRPGVGAVAAASADEILGVNDRVQLAQARALLRDRIVAHWMREGVTVVDPQTTWIGVDVTLEADSVVHQNTQLHGRTHVARLAAVGPDTTLRDIVVGEGARVRRTEATEARIGPGAQVGPFSFLRPGTVLAAGAKVGAYVETKNAVVGEGSKVPHLSYVGDATIGAGRNIGAATVFVNYDGVDKHRTVVGDQCGWAATRCWSRPLTIGDGAYTAAGSVITDDVPPGAMAVGSRPPAQRRGLGRRKRAGSEARPRPQRRPVPARECRTTRARLTDDRSPPGRNRDRDRHQDEQPEALMLISAGAPPGAGRGRRRGARASSWSRRTAYDFANGEIFVRFEESVRGCDAFVIQSHTAPINKWIMEQLIMVDALKRASAKRITVVLPFYGYARQDKKHRGREPISARLIADLFRTAGADRLMTVDLHTGQIQGFFDGPVDHLFATPLLAGTSPTASRTAT